MITKIQLKLSIVLLMIMIYSFCTAAAIATQCNRINNTASKLLLATLLYKMLHVHTHIFD